LILAGLVIAAAQFALYLWAHSLSAGSTVAFVGLIGPFVPLISGRAGGGRKQQDLVFSAASPSRF
jgi:hypothetical protein